MKQKKYILTLALFSYIVSFGQTPNWAWAKRVIGNNDDCSYGIITDFEENIYITGAFKSDTIILSNITLINTDTSSLCNFIAKCDPLGNIIWAKNIGLSGFHRLSLSSDASGNILLTGQYGGDSIIFDNITLTNTDNSSCDIFIVKYNKFGNVLWAKSAGSDYIDESADITTDSENNIYITGSFSGDSITFDNDILINSGQSADFFITKYDSSGNVIWTKKALGNNMDNGNGITTDYNGNIYITGNFFSSNIVFDSFSLSNSGFSDICIVKYNTFGNVLWAKKYGSSNFDYGANIITDTYGNIYTTGIFESPFIIFDSITLTNLGLWDIYLLKCDSTGNVLWAKSFGGIDNEHCLDITNDNLGNIFLTGWYDSPYLTIDNTILYNAGERDIFIVKFDTYGNVLLAKSFGGSGSDAGYGIVADSYGNIYHTGRFASSSINFGAIDLANTDTSGTMSDIFIAKINSNVGVNEHILKKEYSVTIFPNPTTKNFTIIVPSETKEILILNYLGQVVQNTFVDKQTNFNFSLKNNGIYIIQTLTNKQNIIMKLIVTN
ncbi:MAG: T9SS type A sorting domain-containing protein [Bacteroidetes bacterium]|nr:T9SS type A sorting domain-containing protein [Bacteroidota bacterium]